MYVHPWSVTSVTPEGTTAVDIRYHSDVYRYMDEVSEDGDQARAEGGKRGKLNAARCGVRLAPHRDQRRCESHRDFVPEGALARLHLREARFGGGVEVFQVLDERARLRARVLKYSAHDEGDVLLDVSGVREIANVVGTTFTLAERSPVRVDMMIAAREPQPVSVGGLGFLAAKFYLGEWSSPTAPVLAFKTTASVATPGLVSRFHIDAIPAGARILSSGNGSLGSISLPDGQFVLIGGV